MKKTYMLLLVAALGTSACNKTYTCTCKDPTRGNKQIEQLKITAKYEGDASIKCTNREISYNKIAMYGYVSCTIEK